MKRSIEKDILSWLKNGKKAFLIEGARQVGKTYSIREVLKKTNTSFFEINFIEREDILNSLKKVNDINEFIEKIQLYSPKKLIKGKSVIFFDEIQCFPEIITKVKFLVDEGSFKYILSGSLLGIELKSIKSMPIGYLEVKRMYPMTFFEFIIALGVNEDKITYLKQCFDKKEIIDELTHKKMLSLFYTYLIVGGMPSVVNTFLQSKNLLEVDKEQKNIIQLYKYDFSKYENIEKKLKLISIYDNIPSQLNKQNLRFIFIYLNKELKFDRYENSFLWLKEAGVSLPVYNISNFNPPLVMSKEKNNFKLFLSDVGLLTSYFPFSIRENIISNSNNYNYGALFENFACQEIVANNLIPYYFKSSKIGEIDFVIEVDDKIVAIEIKSGKNFKIHKALNNLLKTSKNIETIVFCNNNIKNDDVLYLPIYMIGLLKTKIPNNEFINININGLK